MTAALIVFCTMLAAVLVAFAVAAAIEMFFGGEW